MAKKGKKVPSKGKAKRICPCGGQMDEVRTGWVCRDCGSLVVANRPLKQKDGPQ
jgi:hypothetical protein